MTRVLFLVNGGPESAAAVRAVAFVSAFGTELETAVEYRTNGRVASIGRFLTALVGKRPDVVYVMDMAYSGVLAGGLYRLVVRNRLIIDTGDAIAELARSVGERGRIGLRLTDWLERFGTWVADGIVVRGSRHSDLLGDLGKPVVLVQDGVETRAFRPVDDRALREALAPSGSLIVGLVGSCIWSDRLGIGYGWELAEVIHLLRDRKAVGIMVGGGPGLSRLKARCAELGVADRIRFVGPVPYDDLPRYLGAMDFCLSTQTNDVPGNVRTTGKLPLYLAAGSVVLASRVGEAALVLNEQQLVDYAGVVDPEYPARLADRITELSEKPELMAQIVAGNRILAREQFEYRDLAKRVLDLIVALARRVVP